MSKASCDTLVRSRTWGHHVGGRVFTVYMDARRWKQYPAHKETDNPMWVDEVVEYGIKGKIAKKELVPNTPHAVDDLCDSFDKLTDELYAVEQSPVVFAPYLKCGHEGAYEVNTTVFGVIHFCTTCGE